MKLQIVSIAALIAFALPGDSSAQTNLSGFYVGASGGYGFGTSSHSGLLPAPQLTPALQDCGDGIFLPSCDDDGRPSIKGGLFGAGAGYNIFNGPWLFGVEGDFSYSTIGGSSQSCGSRPHVCATRLETFGTARGRVGLMTNDWLLFATGGWAFGDVSGHSAAKTSGDAFYSGWVAGGGVEKLIARNVSVKLEYLYGDLGSRQLYQATVPGFPETVDLKVNSIRLGVNYLFQPASVPASAIIRK